MGAINPGIALAVNPPVQAQGPLDQARSGMSLQALINQTNLQKQEQAQNALKQQSDQIALQQQQQDQEDNQKLRQAFMDAKGDWDQTMSNAQTSGVNPQKIFQLQAQHTDQLTKLATLHKDQLDNETAKHDAVARDAQTVLAADPADRQALWTKLSNQHYLNGTYQPGEIPATVPDENGLTEILHSSKAVLADLNAAADLKKKQAEDPTVQAEQSAKRIQTGAGMLVNASDEPTHQLILGSLKKQGLTPDEIAQLPQHYSPDNKQALQTMSLSPEEQAKLQGTGAAADAKYRNIVQTQKLGQPVSPADVAWKAAYVGQKELNATTRFNLQQNAGGHLSDPALDAAAEKYFQTGSLPPIGRGGAGQAKITAIMNRTEELHPGESLSASSANYKANEGSLKKAQTNFDQVNAFENTALKNLDQVAQAATAVPELGARFANTPVRMISAQVLGTPEMARFRTALLTAQTEAAKVLGSANATGVLSDSARHEAQDVLDGNLPYPAMMASINQLKTDFGNRHDAYQQQIGDIQKRLGGKSSTAEAPAGGGGSLPQGGGKTIDKSTAQQFYQAAGGDPAKARTLATQNGWKLN